MVRAELQSMSFWTTPMMMPPMMLTMVIIMPAFTSPETNLQAPSMAP